MLQLLENKEVVFLSDFCKALDGVSESTVRRDLKTLEQEGQIILLRGGGACLKQGSYEMPVNSKGIKNVSEKEQIARYAAGLVKDGESIYLDSGSTLYRMLPHLKGKDINVITTNALVFTDMQDLKMKCFIIGRIHSAIPHAFTIMSILIAKMPESSLNWNGKHFMRLVRQQTI